MLCRLVVLCACLWGSAAGLRAAVDLTSHANNTAALVERQHHRGEAALNSSIFPLLILPLIPLIVGVTAGTGATVVAGLAATLSREGATTETLALVIHEAAMIVKEFTIRGLGSDDLREAASGLITSSVTDWSGYTKAVIAVSSGEDTAVRAESLQRKMEAAKRLDFMAISCARKLEPMDLGSAASSSRSGALFWKCGKPEEGEENFLRVLLKGGIRDGVASPEWQAFKQLSSKLRERFDDVEHPTLLNRVLVGFDAFDTHWLAIEHMGAEPYMHRLAARTGLVIPDEVDFRIWDLKPLPSRAPMVPKLLLDLSGHRVPYEMFIGWRSLRQSLLHDLEFLERWNIIDQSLLVQTAGPFKVQVPEDFDEGAFAEDFYFVFSGGVRCAYHLHSESRESERSLTVVCVNIMDYFLTLTTVKSIQNSLQSSRWDHYGSKTKLLFDCLGHLEQETCEDYQRLKRGEWLELFEEDLAENEALQEQIERVEQNYRCCCNLDSTEGEFTAETLCRWDKYGDTASWWSGCPGSLKHVKPSKGGCSDIDPPDDPPESKCSAEESCCCQVNADERRSLADDAAINMYGFDSSSLNGVYRKTTEDHGPHSVTVWRKDDGSTTARYCFADKHWYVNDIGMLKVKTLSTRGDIVDLQNPQAHSSPECVGSARAPGDMQLESLANHANWEELQGGEWHPTFATVTPDFAGALELASSGKCKCSASCSSSQKMEGDSKRAIFCPKP
eukprot:TRINITY_DN59508_c0_g1_i1.p1 TRINITY_DN59508_c0_g1~~TRINITY_DN59508_c0_g1_i1.p1  ORF type:complete len:730 (-),score=129.48 TRINITY_DN59508_c0_g1_i1:30-2219(-)